MANNVKKVLVQAVSAIWTFIAPFLPWIAGFVFLVIMFLTLFSSVVIYAYCYEEDPRVIRSTLEVALTGNLAAGLSVTGLSDPAAPKSELRQYLEKEGGVCRKINPNFCADGGIGSQGVSNDGGGIGVDGVSCLSVKSGLSPELRAFMRTLSIAEGTKDTAGYYRLVGGKEFPSTNKTHPGVEDPSLFSKTGLNSDAFGKYQMLSTTWNGWASSANVPIAKQGTNSRGEKFYDISPQYQDQAVANQLRVNGVEGDLKSKGISGTLQSNSFVCQWASVPAPHSGCSQKNSQSGGFVQNYEKILAEEKSPGGCGQGSQDLPATAVLEKFDLSLNNPALIKQSNDYSEEDLKNKLDELEWRVKDEGIHNVLGSIFSGNVQVEAQSDIQAERERLAGLFRDGKLSSQDGDDISNSLMVVLKIIWLGGCSRFMTLVLAIEVEPIMVQDVVMVGMEQGKHLTFLIFKNHQLTVTPMPNG
ncbi:glycoside hydrolase family 104 protein [Candidatus Gracilibacteria bacterium]|nr:glycoside hydrolase family 104 protein [Candidatus Gracilibacteria bacterium]